MAFSGPERFLAADVQRRFDEPLRGRVTN